MFEHFWNKYATVADRTLRKRSDRSLAGRERSVRRIRSDGISPQFLQQYQSSRVGALGLTNCRDARRHIYVQRPVYGLPVVVYDIPISDIERGKLVLADPAAV